MDHLKMYFLLNMVIFQYHVGFQEGSHKLSNEKRAPGCLGYKGWYYTTQLFGDFPKSNYKDPYQTTSITHTVHVWYIYLFTYIHHKKNQPFMWVDIPVPSILWVFGKKNKHLRFGKPKVIRPIPTI